MWHSGIQISGELKRDPSCEKNKGESQQNNIIADQEVTEEPTGCSFSSEEN